MYWQEFVQTKIDECYARRYARLSGSALSNWNITVTVLRTVTSAGSISAWLVWKKYTWVWAVLLGASQLAEALKGISPLYKRTKTLGLWSKTLNRIFVDAQRDWDSIASGQYTNQQIRALLHRLRSRKQRAQEKYVSEGLYQSEQMFFRAEKEAALFFKRRYYVDEE